MGGNRQIVLKQRPKGMADESCFAEVDGDIPIPGDGEMLIRTTHLTIDPAIRGWLNEKGSGYLPGVHIGAPVRGSGVGEVIESNALDYPVGSTVTNMSHWQEYSIATDDRANRPFEYATLVPAGAPPLQAATVLANSGWTAYAAMTRILQPADGEHVLVTSASSSVGCIAGQLAKRAGAYVVGTAGSAEKCRWIVDDLGFDHCIDYRAESVDQRVKELFPHGIDVLLDNVGGETLDTLLRRIAVGSRVLLCGSVSLDNATEPYRLANYDRLMSRRATMMGFNTADHLDLAAEATENLGAWLADGTLQFRINLKHGLDAAPSALMELYHGTTPGKIVIEL